MSDLNGISDLLLRGLTKGPGNTETDSKVVEFGIGALLVGTGIGLMKFLSNSKADVNEIHINGFKASSDSKKK